MIVNIFQSQQLLNKYQPEDLNFDLAQEFSLLKQLVSLSFLVETISLLMSIHTRIEMIFVCVDKEPTQTTIAATDKYGRLTKIKDLLDKGILTHEEFEIEKKKILAEK